MNISRIPLTLYTIILVNKSLIDAYKTSNKFYYICMSEVSKSVKEDAKINQEVTFLKGLTSEQHLKNHSSSPASEVFMTLEKYFCISHCLGKNLDLLILFCSSQSYSETLNAPTDLLILIHICLMCLLQILRANSTPELLSINFPSDHSDRNLRKGDFPS